MCAPYRESGEHPDHEVAQPHGREAIEESVFEVYVERDPRGHGETVRAGLTDGNSGC